MPAEAVTVTPHDPRRTAFRAVVAALKAANSLSPYVAAWEVQDGDTATDDVKVRVDDHVVRLTPVLEREDFYCHADDGVKVVWQAPVLVQIETLVASGNIDNAINLAGLLLSVAMAMPQEDQAAAGIAWIDPGQPPASPPIEGRAVSSGSFRLMVFVER